jgi:hypothetical protein
MQLDPTTHSGIIYKQYEETLRENEILHAENALKLTQILDLEQLLYETRILDLKDGSPCWCTSSKSHTDYCIKARQVTEPFWKK